MFDLYQKYKKYKSIINEYAKQILEGNAAVFAGAGLSRDAGMVDWKGLLKSFAEELELDIEKETDLISLIQYYTNQAGGRGAVNQKLMDLFTEDATITENCNILASLPIGIYWTTNYDLLLEKAIGQCKILDCKKNERQLAINIKGRDVVIYKMHGDVDDVANAVLTKDDYETYNEKRALFTTTLRGDLVSKKFLFIGFSFDDPNISYILSRIRILLLENAPRHYCFFRKVAKNDYADDTEYQYAKIKQNLRIEDLKRYGIDAVLVDKYSEITDILRLIQWKVKQHTVFISGSADNYGDVGENATEELIEKLVTRLCRKQLRLISGFGSGIGSMVVNTTLSYINQDLKRHMEDYLLLKPFPQNIIDSEKHREIWHNYRRQILSDAGIAIFIFGNKLQEGKIVEADGVIQEFQIAEEKGLTIIPLGFTGYAARRIWELVMKEPKKYYGANELIISYIRRLGDGGWESVDQVVEYIIKAIDSIN